MPAESSRYPDAPTDNQPPMSDDSHARQTSYDKQKEPRYPTYGEDYPSPYQPGGDEYAPPSYDDQGYPHYDGSVDDQMQFLQNLYSNLYKNHNDTQLPPVYNSNSTGGGDAADYPDPYSPDKSYILENSSSSHPRWTPPGEGGGLRHVPRTLEIDESYENVLSWCCTRGRNWGVGHDTCDGIPPMAGTYQQTCAMAQRKCCEKSLDERGCELGISSARNMTACDSIAPTFEFGQCQADNVKTCCDCCALGLKSHGMGLSCDMEILGHPCSGAYSKCCREGAMTSSSSQDAAEPNSGSSNFGGAVTILPNGADAGCRETGGGGCDHECEDLIGGGFRCTCRSGYALGVDEKSCEDVNECALGSHTCGAGELCFNSLGSYTCQRRLSCGTGYVLTSDNTCDDIDECALKIDKCRGSTECVNIRGSFRCVPRQCGSGFVTDAAGSCIDINECFSGDFRCPATATCKNTPGSYVCLCHGGYELSADASICQDINECAAATSPCDDTATCVNTDGSYQCITIPTLTCMPGYTPNEDETECVDVDECAEGMDDCAVGSTCINLDGSFECAEPVVCRSGERHNYDRTACEDIDECVEHLDSCGHGGRCVNSPGSYICLCEQGYVKRSGFDGRMRCEDVDECSTQEPNCQYRCVNTPGQYFCECPAGYTIKDERTCVDIDECQLGTAACHPDETCFNTKGSYKCVNITCPDNYTKLPKRRCSRVSCGGDKRKRSLREMRACSKLPKQIVFHNISLANGTDVHRPLFRMYVAKSSPTDRHTFHITSGNGDDMFSVAKTKKDGRVAGVVYSKRELVGPKDYTLDLTLRLSRRRRYISLVARLFIYVSDHVF